MALNRKKKETEDLASQVEEEIESDTNKLLDNNNTRVEFIDSGSTVLNLVLSGKGKKGGWARGRVINIIGDGSSGKTWLSLELAASCFYHLNKNPETFAKVKRVFIVINNVEGVMDFPLEEAFGAEFVKTIEWIQIPTIEAMGRDYTRRVEALKEGDFLLYINDSLDALVSEEGRDRFLAAAEKDKPEEGSYGMEKQKYTGKFFGNLCSIGKGKDATLILISQVRENIGVTFGKKLRRVGGKSLDFYTHQCCWLAVKEKLTKTVLGEKRAYGIEVKAKLERSKVSKPFREGNFIILFDFGIDNIWSNIRYLFGEKPKEILFDDKKFKTEEGLIHYIEKNKLQDKVIEMVENKWNEIEEGIKPEREKRF